MAPEFTTTTWDDDQVIRLAHRFGDGSPEKSVPAELFSLPKRQISLFLRHLWATDGSVTVSQNSHGGRISYPATSRLLVDDLARLLLRFGISSRIHSTATAGFRGDFTLDISGADDQRRFLNEIGVHGAKGENVVRLLDVLEPAAANPSLDTVPDEIWNRVRGVLTEPKVAQPEFAAAMGNQSSGSTVSTHGPSRQRLGQVAELLGDAELEMHAVNDVFWDTVVSVEPDGEEDVFDATVVGTHNFIANGIAVHNSIEQDADIVILLHREDAYEKESPRAGEADFIIAKHRNGPTDTITVAFQGHYSRFVDMAT
jgi:replicative DNA helicase